MQRQAQGSPPNCRRLVQNFSSQTNNTALSLWITKLTIQLHQCDDTVVTYHIDGLLEEVIDQISDFTSVNGFSQRFQCDVVRIYNRIAVCGAPSLYRLTAATGDAFESRAVKRACFVLPCSYTPVR